uniref:Uncharacterized protein n=1 Tax=Plectus sambesii TaxID=2011161 RepID=A0A914UVT3_9BILA
MKAVVIAALCLIAVVAAMGSEEQQDNFELVREKRAPFGGFGHHPMMGAAHRNGQMGQGQVQAAWDGSNAQTRWQGSAAHDHWQGSNAQARWQGARPFQRWQG